MKSLHGTNDYFIGTQFIESSVQVRSTFHDKMNFSMQKKKPTTKVQKQAKVKLLPNTRYICVSCNVQLTFNRYT